MFCVHIWILMQLSNYRESDNYIGYVKSLRNMVLSQNSIGQLYI